MKARRFPPPWTVEADAQSVQMEVRRSGKTNIGGWIWCSGIGLATDYFPGDLWFNILCALIGAVVVGGTFYCYRALRVARMTSTRLPRPATMGRLGLVLLLQARLEFLNSDR